MTQSYGIRGRGRLIPFDQFVSLIGHGQKGDFTYQVLWDGQITTCARCGLDIGWGLSANRKWIPFDPGSDAAEYTTVHWSTCNPAAAIKEPEPSGLS